MIINLFWYILVNDQNYCFAEIKTHKFTNFVRNATIFLQSKSNKHILLNNYHRKEDIISLLKGTEDWYFAKDWHKIGILQRTDTRLVFYKGLTQDWYFTKDWHKIGILQRTDTRLVFYKGLTQDWYFTKDWHKIGILQLKINED